MPSKARIFSNLHAIISKPLVQGDVGTGVKKREFHALYRDYVKKREFHALYGFGHRYCIILNCQGDVGTGGHSIES
jgi:hypothetical protein